MLAELNARFGIAGALVFAVDPNGFIKANLSAPSGFSASLYLYGAHLTSWRTPTGEELLYLSPKAEFVGGKAIRGGVPIIFPQFSGQGPLPAHGFARNSMWELTHSERMQNGDVLVELSLHSNQGTRQIWNHEFELSFRVTLGASLKIEMQVKNTSTEDFNFQDAYHTYFGVSTIDSTSILGLSGATLTDFLDANSHTVETRERIQIAAATDRIYQAAPDTITIEDGGARRSIVVRKHNLPDAVVWNPWAEKCAAIKDMPADGYRHFVCIEGGNIVKRITLAPGQTHTDGHEFEVNFRT